MRAPLHGERVVTLGLVGVAALLVGLTVLTLGYRSQIQTFRRAVHTQCVSRGSYDEASQQARGAMARLYRTLQDQERILQRRPAQRNGFTDALLRQQRVAAYGAAIASLDHALRVGAPSGCSQYR